MQVALLLVWRVHSAVITRGLMAVDQMSHVVRVYIA